MSSTTYALCLDGAPSIGLANCVAHVLEECTPFAAFKMPHPLQKDAHVIFVADDASAATRKVCEACMSVRDSVDTVLAALPEGDNVHAKPRLIATLCPRQIEKEC